MIGRTNCINLDAYSNYSNTIITNRKTSSIIVDYPVGYECSCVHDDTTYIADNTNGQWLFRVKEPGTWSIEVDEASGYENQNIIVSDLGTIQCVNLLPTGYYHPINNYIIDSHYTFHHQAQKTASTSDISATGPHIYSPGQSSSWVEGYLDQPMHIEKWMKNMKVKITGRGYALCVGLKTNITDSYTSASAGYVVYANGGQATSRTDYTLTVDISSIARTIEYDTNNYYFTFRTAGSSSPYVGNMTVHDLYFE